jgi:hypothetical protein
VTRWHGELRVLPYCAWLSCEGKRMRSVYNPPAFPLKTPPGALGRSRTPGKEAFAAGSSRADADIFDTLFANWGAEADPLVGGAPLGSFDDLLWDPSAGAATDQPQWLQVR